MNKVRVYELARELDIESKALMARMKAEGIQVATHQSTLSDEEVARIRAMIRGASAPATVSGAGGVGVGTQTTRPTKVIVRRRRDEGPAADTASAGATPSPGATSAPSDGPASTYATPQSSENAPSVDRSAVSESPQPSLKAQESPAPSGPPPAPTTAGGGPAAATAASVASPSSATRAPVHEAAASSVQGPPLPPPAPSTGSRLGSGVSATVVRREPPPPPRPSGPNASGPTPPTGSRVVRPEPRGPVARVVRRASDEESQAAQAQYRGDRRGALRREDSRGVRVTDTFAPRSLAEIDAEQDGWARKKGDRGRKKVESTEVVETEAESRARALKERRASINTRDLLRQVDEEDGGEPILEGATSGDEVEAPSIAPVDDSKLRTVYMPAGPQRRRDLRRRKGLKKTSITTPRASYRVVRMTADRIQLSELAHQMSVKATEIIAKLMSQGQMLTITSSVDQDTAVLIAGEYGFEVERKVRALDEILGLDPKRYDRAKTVPRPPIVTVMGHVDHGKTSILDAIRQTNVTAGEAGGITQHIGAYSVEHRGHKITFLDTPGHEAFSAMRARGAELTDIVVLVVAADDGVMPQTIEAISHAKTADVPIVVAVNKIDKPNINLNRVYTELTEHGIQAEEWGGEVQFVKVSALEKTGIDELLEAIMLQAEILELGAASDIPAEALVVEAHLDRGRGPVATVVVQHGTLCVGQSVVVGCAYGRIRAMQDYRGRSVARAEPSTPVELIGLNDVPEAGDPLFVAADEKVAREAAEFNVNQTRVVGPTAATGAAANFEQLLGQIQAAERPEVPWIIKGDTQGSVEAIREAVTKQSTDKVANRIIHAAVGGITESDLTLARAAKAVVLGFNVRAGRDLDAKAERDGVTIKYFSIIYELVDAVRAVMAGTLPPVLKEVVLGHAEVRQSFQVPKIGTIAGASVTDGKITRSSSLRLIRDAVVIYNGKIGSLRRFKDDVREVQQGYECGIGIEGYSDIRTGDVIEAYVVEEEAPTL